MGLIRYLIFGIIIYTVYNFLRKAIAISDAPAKKNITQDDNVIEICPDCGEVNGKGHKCKK